MKKIIVAIDGYSSCGKSTLAKGLAKVLHYAYLDSGAMYRAVTLYFLENKVDYNDEKAVDLALKQINIHFERIEGQNHTFLNGKDIEHEIRAMAVSEEVSPVSAISAVRRAMVKQQQAMGTRRGIVADGRDIGTVVFPDAELKIFLTADPDVRTSRRHLELAAKGIDANWDDIQRNLLTRDRIDSTRADSPLMRAEDALIVDNTLLSEDQQLEKALQLAKSKIYSNNIKIRVATAADMPEVHALMYELAVYEKSPESVAATVEEYTEDFENGLFESQVAEMDGKIVGMILYYMAYSSWKGKMLYLDDFVISEEYRQFGIGQMLFDTFLQEGKKRECRLVKWQVLDWNEPAIRFYEKNEATIEKDWWNVKIIF